MASPSSPQVGFPLFFPIIIINYFFFFPFPESPLAIALNVPCNVFAATIPEKFIAITEITSLSLTNSNLTALPESLGLLFCYSFFLFFASLHHPPPV